MEGLVVQKYGGTSVATPSARLAVIRNIQRVHGRGSRVVVVVSAMGRRGEPYATDTLLDLLRQTGTRVDPRDYDFIFVCGEMISAALLSHTLKQSGISAIALTGGQAGIKTDNAHGEAKVVNIDVSAVWEYIRRGLTPVVTGSQGVIKETDELTTLGRGGSDTSAVALGGALNAQRVEIFTDVRGVGRADPRLIPGASVIGSIDYETMIELARYGARVIHPQAVQCGLSHQIPIVVKSTFESSPGTMISGTGRPDGVVAMTVMKCVGTKPLELDLDGRSALTDRANLRILRDAMTGSSVVADVEGDGDELIHLLRQFGRREAGLHAQTWLSLVGQDEALDLIAEGVRRALHTLSASAGASERVGRRLTFVLPEQTDIQVLAHVYQHFVASDDDEETPPHPGKATTSR